MKKYIIYVLIIVFAVSACKKDSVNKQPAGKLSKVTFKVGYSQSTGNFNAAAHSGKLSLNSIAVTQGSDSTLSSNAQVLYVAVYQPDGSRLFLTKQLVTDTAFGKVNYNLAPGNYTVVFAAGQNGLLVSSFNNTLANDVMYYNTQTSNGTVDTRFKDSYFKKISLTVGANGISQSVSLNRIVSEIIVNVEDAIPQSVKFMAMYVTAGSFADINAGVPDFKFSTAMPEGDDGFCYINTPPNIPLTTGVKNFKLSLIVLNVAKAYHVRVFAINTLQGNTFSPGNSIIGDAIADIIINNVTVQTNHQTTLTGQLFGGNGVTNTGGFQVTLDPVWNPTPINVGF